MLFYEMKLKCDYSKTIDTGSFYCSVVVSIRECYMNKHSLLYMIIAGVKILAE